MADLGEDLPLVETPGPAAPPRPKARTGLWILVGAATGLLGVSGWLAYAHTVDRAELEALESDLLAARDHASASSTKPEESGEAASASALAVRTDAVFESPWWDRVVVRILDIERLNSAWSQCGELSQHALDRRENRAWWKESSERARGALVESERTIPAVLAAADEFSDAAEPRAGAGGFDPDARTAIIAAFDADSQSLIDQQNQSLASLQEALAAIRAAASLDLLAPLVAGLDAPLPTDRNPPELSQALSRMREQAASVGEFLASRDAIQMELEGTLQAIDSFDQEDGSRSAMASIKDRLVNLRLPEDARFDAPREAAARAADAATSALARLDERDAALAWMAARRDELDTLRSIEEIAVFVQTRSKESPKSDNPRVEAAQQDLLARITVRAAALEEERRLLEESQARAVVFDTASERVEAAFAAHRIGEAASLIELLAPETPDQAARLALTRTAFASRTLTQLQELRTSAAADGSWSTLAGSLRDTLGSPDAASLAPTLAQECADLWNEAAVEEDHAVYEDIRRLAHAPFGELNQACQWYLDPARLRGDDSPMHDEVTRLMQSIETPGATVQVEGIEWSDPGCEWGSPRTAVSVTIDDEPFSFELGGVSPLETTLLGQEAWLGKAQDQSVTFGINGYFDCADDDGVFAGSGALLMDDLRCGGRLALPFWNDADSSLAPHKLLLVSIPDDQIRAASELPVWVDPRPAPAPPVADESPAAPAEPAASAPIDPTDPSNPNAD
ncbi:MAG: hypothetical protein EXS03_09260 [Phycisphaerales bacterium]|nr:hypothetical protein [Phycisphaerales bacterium]